MASSRKSPNTEACTAELPAAGAALDRHVRAGQHVCAGLSGGIDSVVLLHVLKTLLPARKCTLTALHVHHGLSPNADAWQEFCVTLCIAWNIPLVVRTVAVSRDSGAGIEAAARLARHEVYASTKADWLALAHHRADQAETLLFNLVRGAGIRGAAAMQESTGSRLLRPLLHVSRADIANYAANHGLDWVNDESNSDTRYSRNFLRHEVLPVLAARFPGTEANLAAAAQRFAEAGELLDELAVIDLSGRPLGFPLPVALIAGLSRSRGRNLLRFLLQRQGVRLPSQNRLEEAMRQLIDAASDRHPEIGFGAFCLYRRRGEIFLRAC
jgi:tRNA(Ile)-lysidine synthase